MLWIFIFLISERGLRLGGYDGYMQYEEEENGVNVLVVNSPDISALPPVRNLVSVLAENGHNVTILTRNKNNIYFTDTNKIRIIPLPENKYTGFLRIFNYLKRAVFIRHTVDKEMPNNDILWTTTDSTVRELKGRVLKYKHIMQLMELVEDIPEIQPFQFKNVNLKKYAQRAYKVVVPEYNRAHIQKTWWDLKETPAILPNKPVDEEIDMSKIPVEALEIINKVKQEKRKIVLYQGVFTTDRKLETYAKFFESLSDEYGFYILGRESEYRKQLCNQYPYITYLGFLPPPYHLLITKLAYISLLPYAPNKLIHHSILNALYCAPNKIYEYAKYGIPMIGNDVPGLALPFDKYGIGSIYHGGGAEEMRTIIEEIEANYKEMSDNCRKFYADTDLYKIVENIIS